MDWEIDMTGHVQEVHANCERDTCMVCDLYICRVCGALEGALLPVCPGRRLTMDEHDHNYRLYCEGIGPFAVANAHTVSEALNFAAKYVRDGGGEGALRYYEAVVELARHVCGLDDV